MNIPSSEFLSVGIGEDILELCIDAGVLKFPSGLFKPSVNHVEYFSV